MNQVEKEYSIIHVILCLISLVAISSGLIGEDIFFDTATYGPIMLIGLGVLVLSLSIETNHLFSKRLDSTIFKIIKVKEVETKWFNFLITLLLLFVGCLLFLLCIYSISKKDPENFSINVFFFSLSVGISIARIFTSLRGNQYSSYSVTRTSNQLKVEHLQLRDFLLGKNDLQKQYFAKMFRQSELISEEIARQLELNSGKFMIEITTILDDYDSAKKFNFSDIVYSILRMEDISDSRTMNEWTKYSLNSFFRLKDADIEAKRCFDKLASHLLLNPIKSIVEFWFSKESSTHSYVVSDKLLVLLSETAVNTGNENLFASNLTRYSSIVNLGSSDDGNYSKYYLHDVGFYSNPERIDETSKWSPWWLISLRLRLSVLKEGHDWDESIRLDKSSYTGRNVSFEVMCSRAHIVMSHLLSQTEVYSDNTQDLSQMIASKYRDLFKGESMPVTYIDELKKKARNDGSLNDRLIRISYIIFREIHHIRMG